MAGICHKKYKKTTTEDGSPAHSPEKPAVDWTAGRVSQITTGFALLYDQRPFSVPANREKSRAVHRRKVQSRVVLPLSPPPRPHPTPHPPPPTARGISVKRYCDWP